MIFYNQKENNMAFSRPTRYWQLNPDRIPNSQNNKRELWDRAVKEASDEYKMRMVNYIIFIKRNLVNTYIYFS